MNSSPVNLTPHLRRAPLWRAALAVCAGLACLFYGTLEQAHAADGAAALAGQNVVDVQVQGHQDIPLNRIAQQIRTRPGRPFDPKQVEEDVQRLNRSRMFVDVRAQYQQSPGGLVVIFQVVERRTIKYIKFLGREKIWREKSLHNQINMKVGEPLDPFTVEESRKKLEEFYREKGHAKVRVTLLEGDQPADRGVVFLLHEGPRQKIRDTEFIGNTIASDARLRTQISSKPPRFFIFKGFLDREQLDADVDKLTAYYRALGFFQARIGRELEWNEERDRVELTFVIDEGPRFLVRNIRFMGNTKFSTDQLNSDLKLETGQFFDQAKMDRDVLAIQDVYGGRGYVFADVRAEPRFLEEPGQLDLVYKVEEGARYRVGRINVHIGGENPHTKQTAVLNRLSIRPGDIADTRELRASERRLRASAIFQNNPALGNAPRIVFTLPDEEDEDRELAERPRRDGVRGQSPDPEPHSAQRPATSEKAPLAPDERLLDIDIVAPQKPASRPAAPDDAKVGTPTPVKQNDEIIIRGQDPGWGAAARQTTPAGGSPWRPSSETRVAQAPRGPAAGGTPYNAPPYAERSPYAPPGGFAGAAPQAGGPTPLGAPPQAYPPAAPPNYNPPGGYSTSGELFPDGGYFNGNDPNDQLPEVPVDVYVDETQTGRIMLGVGVNSNAGLVGNFVVDEQNFDITRWPRRFSEIRNGTAFRGAGQQFRLEAVPGTQFQRYGITFRDPYLFNTPISFGINGYFFNRQYRDWTEQRVGATLTGGYQIRPDLSAVWTVRGEDVKLSQPSTLAVPSLAAAVGHTDFFSSRWAIIQDTRDSAFLPTEGHRIELAFEQAFGEFSFPRGDIDLRKHFTLRQRPDGSGRHVLTVAGALGIAGNDTPIFENYYAGGFSTLRGFRFRGVGPQELGVFTGGRFQMLTSIEYLFPITADDVLRGVLFCDAGTVEQSFKFTDDFRVAPGFGLRISIPALGPAPIALDFAVPVNRGPGDQIQNFSFFIGMSR